MARADRADIDAIAATWVVREDRGPLPEPERLERDRWLAASPRHYGAYARARAVLAWSGRASGVAAPVRRRRGLRRWLPATAAVLLAGVAALLWSAWSPGTVHQTARGQILRVALEDGSTVTLDAETRLRVRYTAHGRELQLLRGTALFDVASDPRRPFSVDAAGTRVTAVGTRFSVGVDRLGRPAGPVEVLVSEGVVDVADGGANPVPARLQAGMRALVRPTAGVEIAQVEAQELDQRLMWREGMLAFNGDTLSVAAARFRHYSQTAILIDDPDVGSRRVVGLYPASDPVGFARNVALSLGLEVQQVEDGIRLSAPARAAGRPPGRELQ